MSEEKNENKVKALVPIDKQTGQLAPTDLEGMWRIATIMSASGMVPSDYRNKPEKCFVAMQLGMEVGLGFMAAIQTISVINGKPAIYGDGVPAIVQSRGKCEKWVEHFELNGETMKHYSGPANLNEWPDELTAVCILHRKGFDEPFEGYFSVADAKRMGKWNKPESTALSVWQKYPLRMLKMRARGFATRDGFSDHLKGIGIFEDLQDEPEIVSTVVDTKDTDPIDQILKTDGEGQIVEAEWEGPEAAGSTQEPKSPQEEALSESETAKQAMKHPLVLDLESKEYNPELIERFCKWAAENNEMDLVSLMNEAMSDIAGFETAMLDYAKEFELNIGTEDAPASTDEPAESPSPEEEDRISDDLASSIEASAKACQAAGATQEGLFDQEDNELDPVSESAAAQNAAVDKQFADMKAKSRMKDPVTGDYIEENADIQGWCDRFCKQWRLKNKHQYSPFVMTSEDKFIQLHTYSPDLYDRAVDKWTRFYGSEPWPVNLAKYEDGGPQEQNKEVSVEDAPKPEGNGDGAEKAPNVVHEVNEGARLFKDEENIDHNEKLKRIKRYWPTEFGKVLKTLKMGNGSLSAAAVEVISFALKEEIAKTRKKEGK